MVCPKPFRKHHRSIGNSHLQHYSLPKVDRNGRNCASRAKIYSFYTNTQRHHNRPNRECTHKHFHIPFSVCQRSILTKDAKNKRKFSIFCGFSSVIFTKSTVFNYMSFGLAICVARFLTTFAKKVFSLMSLDWNV